MELRHTGKVQVGGDMTLTLTYHNPDFPDDYEFGVEGLGQFKNGESREVSEEQEQAFVTANRMLVKDALEGNELFKVEGEAIVSEVPEEETGGEEEEGTATEEGTETEGEGTGTEEPAPA
jgi:hypothetical protein